MKNEIKGPRIGPLQKMPRGKHKGKDILWVIKEDPMEFMIAVKEYLQVSKDQAKLFKQVTKGGVIPERYIFKIKKTTLRELFPKKEEEVAPEQDTPAEEDAPGWTEGMNLHRYLRGDDLKDDKSFLD